MLSLSACAQVSSKNSSLTLPDVIEYPLEAQKKAADEVKSRQCPIIAETFMIDYKIMRDQTKASRKMLKQ